MQRRYTRVLSATSATLAACAFATGVQAHRIAGVVLFCSALVILYDLAVRWRHVDGLSR